jgi:hypothetical protein
MGKLKTHYFDWAIFHHFPVRYVTNNHFGYVESLQHGQSFTRLQEQKLGPWRYKGEVMVDPSYRIEHLGGDWWRLVDEVKFRLGVESVAGWAIFLK